MSKRGLALPFAMFFTGLIFCLCTVMATEAITNLRLTALESEQLRLAAQARGAVARAVYRMNRQAGWEGLHHDLLSAEEDREDGCVLRCWAEVDSTHSHIFHVHARAEQQGTQFQLASATVRRGPDVSGTVYAQVPGYSNGANAIDTAFVLRGGLWQPTPAAVAYYYQGGALRSRNAPPRSIAGGCADPEGNLYMVLHPLWDELVNNPLTHGLMVRILDQSTEHAGIWQVYDLAHALANINIDLPGPRPAIVRVDSQGVTHPLPEIPGFRLNAQGEVERGGNMLGLITQPSCDGRQLFFNNLRFGGDLIYRINLTDASPAWSAIGPPPRRLLYDSQMQLTGGQGPAPLLGSVTQDQHGNMFALYGDWAEGRPPYSGLFRWNEGDGWQSLPPPPRTYYGPTGQLITEPGMADSFCFLRSAPGGELFGMWFPELDNGQILKYSGGVWNPVRPPLDGSPNSLDVDAEGNLLLKYPQPGQPDALFRIRGNEAQRLPSVPNSYRVRDSGELVEGTGQAQTVNGLAGGGTRRSSGTRFFPVADY